MTPVFCFFLCLCVCVSWCPKEKFISKITFLLLCHWFWLICVTYAPSDSLHFKSYNSLLHGTILYVSMFNNFYLIGASNNLAFQSWKRKKTLRNNNCHWLRTFVLSLLAFFHIPGILFFYFRRNAFFLSYSKIFDVI